MSLTSISVSEADEPGASATAKYRFGYDTDNFAGPISTGSFILRLRGFRLATNCLGDRTRKQIGRTGNGIGQRAGTCEHPVDHP